MPCDLGSTQVTGIHVVAYRAARAGLGLPPVEPIICDAIQGLALPDRDLLDLIGHNIQADVPAANLLAMWEALHEFGVYT